MGRQQPNDKAVPLVDAAEEQMPLDLSSPMNPSPKPSRAPQVDFVTELPADFDVEYSAGGAASFMTPLSPNLRNSVRSVCLEFNDVCCTVPNPVDKKAAPKLLLNNVCGVARPGQILAIMGSSGSGKTTLLNILCQRHELTASSLEEANEMSRSATLYDRISKGHEKSDTGLTATGLITMNGQKTSRELFRSVGVYITQEDILLRTYSPRESIAFTAALKLPDSFTKEQREEEVSQLLDILRLEKCADTPVGDFRHPGVSGGERKRTAIGVELLSNPSILCLDEPTTGLDSFTALKVIEVLRVLADNGRTIIMTIHQPSLELFELFDSLLILSEGKEVYFGPAQSSRDYFCSLGMQIPLSTNPADFFVRLVENQLDDDDFLELIDSSKEQTTLMVQTALAASEKKLYLQYIGSHWEHRFATSNLPVLVKENIARPLYEQVWCVTKRSFTNYARQPETTIAQIVQFFFCATLVSLLFCDVGSNQASITTRKGAFFEMMMNLFLLSFFTVACTFPGERPLFLKEKANNLYSTTVYFFSKTILEVGLQCILPVIYVTIVYFAVGFQTVFQNYVMFVCVALLLTNVACSMALMFGALLEIPEFTVQLMPFCVYPLTLFIAIFIADDTVPDYYIWMQWISPFHYAYELFCIIEFDGLVLTCDDDETCTYSSGNDVLTALGIDADNLAYDFIALVIIYGICMVLAYAALLKRKQRV
eukprot:TRINITY_DN4166_c0_g1_i1.p1 TRINITY_DN4166_c0_g1~~TRINITY_DN4166_c0_g1_i1.p1  ORF type:complete len:720 (-),score=180.59 TRINITY_DN4166_c0_g1_i1:130-2259(-)